METRKYDSKDLKFTELVKVLKNQAADYFPGYESDFGIMTNDFNEFLIYYTDSELFEVEENAYIVVYFVSERTVMNIIKYLENYDIVVFADGKIKSNNDISKTLKKMMKMAM